MKTNNHKVLINSPSKAHCRFTSLMHLAAILKVALTNQVIDFDSSRLEVYPHSQPFRSEISKEKATSTLHFTPTGGDVVETHGFKYMQQGACFGSQGSVLSSLSHSSF